MKKHHPEASEDHISSVSGSRLERNILREQAEELLSGKKTPMPPEDTQKVLHELEVHQIELEMQNETLQ